MTDAEKVIDALVYDYTRWGRSPEWLAGYREAIERVVVMYQDCSFEQAHAFVAQRITDMSVQRKSWDRAAKDGR